jgi:hypothetical protein
VQDHNHVGDPTYVAYTLGCRSRDCLSAFNEYKLRLAQRKLSGEYRDLRLKENQLRAEAAAMARQVVVRDVASEPVQGEPVPAAGELPALPEGTSDPRPTEAVTDDPGAAKEYPDDVKVAVLINHILDAMAIATGAVPEQVVRTVAGPVGITLEQVESGLTELMKQGKIRRKEGVIYTRPETPQPAPAPTPSLRRGGPPYAAHVDPATGRVTIR